MYSKNIPQNGNIDVNMGLRDFPKNSQMYDVDQIIKACFPKPDFREYQMATLQMIYDYFVKHGKKYVIVQAPTGSGKSIIAETFAKMFDGSYIVTDQKSLQEQYPYPTVRGRSNFNCLEVPSAHCSNGMCKKDDVFACMFKPYDKPFSDTDPIFAFESAKRGTLYWKGENRCPYWKQKAYAVNSDIVVSNYMYHMTELKYIGDFGKRAFCVSDEGHNVEKHLMNFVSIRITSRDMERIKSGFKLVDVNNGDKSLDYVTEVTNWISFIEDLQKLIPLAITKIEKRMETKKKENIEWYGQGDVKVDLGQEIRIRENLTAMKDKVDYIHAMIVENPQEWVVNINENIDTGGLNYVEFKPIIVNTFADDVFFQFADHHIIMSATILDPEFVARSLNLPPDQYAYVHVPSSFDVNRSPIVNLNIGNLKSSNINPFNKDNLLPNIVEMVDFIIDTMPNTKGIIHTHTHKIAEYICENSIHADKILSYDENANFTREDLIDMHKTIEGQTILCSPSMTEGLNLIDDLSRFQIFTKMPYADLGDKQISARNEIDRDFYRWKTAISLIQGSGRSTRTPDDWSITYTLDSGFLNFEYRNRDLLDELFNSRIKGFGHIYQSYQPYIDQALQKHPHCADLIEPLKFDMSVGLPKPQYNRNY